MPGPFIYPRWQAILSRTVSKVRGSRSLEIGRKDTGVQKKNYSEKLKDRCCQLRMMNISLRLSPLELFSGVFRYINKKENG